MVEPGVKRSTVRPGLPVLCAGLLALALLAPMATAAPPGIGADVAAARQGWTGALVEREAAEVALADTTATRVAADHALVAAEEAHTAAAVLLGFRREQRRAAEAAHGLAVQARDTAARDLQTARRVHDGRVQILDERAEALGQAAASAYIYGDPRIRVLGSMSHALDRAGSVSGFLAATEQLRFVTVDAKQRADAADAGVAASAQLVAAALDHHEHELANERRADRAAREAREAERTQSGMRDTARRAVTAHAEAAAAALEAEHDAHALLTEQHAAVETARRRVARLGWRAGVPGPSGLTWPVDGAPTSGFGLRLHPILEEVRAHNGVDVPGSTGAVVVAAAEGVVTHAGPRGGYGNAVVVAHDGGRSTLYAHLSTVEVRRGQRVDEAQRLGGLGSTGLSTGPHLHFEVHERGRPRDPMPLFRPLR